MKKYLSSFLAVIMIMALLPMSVFGKTENSVSKVVTAKVDTFTHDVVGDVPYLNIQEVTTSQFASDDEFVLTLDGAKWRIGDLTGKNVTYAGQANDSITLEDDVTKVNVMKVGDTGTVTYQGNTFTVGLLDKYTLSVGIYGGLNNPVRFPLLAELTGETATVTVTPTNNSVLTAGTYTFANTTSANAVAKSGGTVKVEIDGESKELEPITITETVKGAFESGEEIKLTLRGEFEFDASGISIAATDNNLKISLDGEGKSDSKNIYLDVTSESTKAAIVSIAGIKVKPTSKCEEGDIAEITISGAGVIKTTFDIAKATSYGISFTAEDKDLPIFYSGRQYPSKGSLKVTFKELSENSWRSAGRTTLTFPNGVNIISVNFSDEKNFTTPDGNTTLDDTYIDINDNVVTIDGGISTTSGKKAEWKAIFYLSIDSSFIGNITVTVGGPALAEDITATVGKAVKYSTTTSSGGSSGRLPSRDEVSASKDSTQQEKQDETQVTQGTSQEAPQNKVVILLPNGGDSSVSGVPVRVITESIGARLYWDGIQSTAIIILNGKTIEIPIGSSVAHVDGSPITLKEAAFIHNGATYLPLDFIAEHLNCDVRFYDGV